MIFVYPPSSVSSPESKEERDQSYITFTDYMFKVNQLAEKWLYVYLDDNLIEEIKLVLLENLEINISSERVRTIVDLNPYVKAKISEYGVNDTEVVSCIVNCVCYYYIKSRWPTFGDNIDVEAFHKKFKQWFDRQEEKKKQV